MKAFLTEVERTPDHGLTGQLRLISDGGTRKTRIAITVTEEALQDGVEDGASGVELFAIKYASRIGALCAGNEENLFSKRDWSLKITRDIARDLQMR